MWYSHSNEFTASSHSNSTPDMIDNHAADHDSAGDLRNWEYLTRMYDHDDLFGERAKSYELVPLETVTHSNAKLPPSTASSASQISSLPWSSAAAVALSTHSNEQRPPMAENFVARVVINTATNAVYLPRQDVSYHSQGQHQQFNAVLGSCSIPSSQVQCQHQPLHWSSEGQDCAKADSCSMERVHRATDAPEMQAQINDMTRLDPLHVSLPMHSLANQLSYNTGGAAKWQQQTNQEPATANPNTEASIQYRNDDFNKPNAQSLHSVPSIQDREVAIGQKSDVDSRSTTPSTDGSAVSGSAQSSTATEPDNTLKRKGGGDCIEKMCLPLSAYNYFYRDESENIVNGMTSADGPLPDPISDFTPERQEKLLHQHWYVDPFKKKRKHRKKHGRIDFSTLAQAITERWKHLTAEGRAFYRAVAEADQAQYDSFRSPLARQRRAALSDKRIDPATSKQDIVQV